MASVEGDLDWYMEISRSRGVTPRCPYASVERCPRYYQSLSLLGEAGSTKIRPEEDARLKMLWETSDLWPRTAEAATSIAGPVGSYRHFSNFCPEIAFLRFGYFASSLHDHSDEIDRDVASEELGRRNEPPGSWRWRWAYVKPLHFTECDLYSPLTLGPEENALARRSPPPPPPRPADLTVDQMRQGIERLRKRLDEVAKFDPTSVTEQYNIPHVDALAAAVDEALARTFGHGTLDYNRYSDAAHFNNGPHNYAFEVPITDVQASLATSKARSIALLNQAITTLEERIVEASSSVATAINPGGGASGRRVFIVHGHDDGTREAVARFLERLGFEVVILHERPNKGRTIITKFREEAADIGFAVVLMTPDDHGGRAGEATRPRARQNVVFELGFFIGALRPDRVAALVKGDLERPSDFDGVVYIPFDDSGGWKQALGKELDAAGFSVDWNQVMRQ